MQPTGGSGQADLRRSKKLPREVRESQPACVNPPTRRFRLIPDLLSRIRYHRVASREFTKADNDGRLASRGRRGRRREWRLPKRHVLLVGGKDRLPADLPSLIEHKSNNAIQAEVARAAQEALTRISKRGFDAVVCWAEREDELALLIRIRKARPKLPILLLTSQESSKFKDLALSMGATRIARNDRDLAALAERVSLTVQGGELRRELASQSSRAHRLAKSIGSLARDARALAEDALNQVRSVQHVWNVPRTSFVPLLVEVDPKQALLMVRAFDKADIFAPLPILKTGEEAISYLQGEAPYEDRELPSLLILDCALPGKSGIEVLEWMRTRPELGHIAVVMLRAASEPTHVNRAYELGVNSYLVKPTQFQSLVELVSGLKRFLGRADEA
jgi:DNA-binding response OmpR family regulator